MTIEAIITLALAILGSLTGTAALLIQWSQHRQDRAKIALSGKMTLGSSINDPIESYGFQLDVVNSGRRVARISEVYIQTDTKPPGARLMIFDAGGDEFVSLEEGQSKRFEQRISTPSLDGLFESFAAEECFTIRLTTGEIHRTPFQTVKKSAIAALRRK